MTELCKKRQQHPSHCRKCISHLWLGLPLSATRLLVAVHASMVIMGLRSIVLLHRVHGNVSGGANTSVLDAGQKKKELNSQECPARK